MLLLLSFNHFHLPQPKRLGTVLKKYGEQEQNQKSTTNPTKFLVPFSAPKTVTAPVEEEVGCLLSNGESRAGY